MGVGISHDAFSGSYRSFYLWRCKLAEIAGIPIHLMAEYYELYGNNPADSIAKALEVFGSPLADLASKLAEALPLQWESLKPDPLHELLLCPDTDGVIGVEYLIPLADRLEELLPLFDEKDYHFFSDKDRVVKFIRGARLAASLGEPLTVN